MKWEMKDVIEQNIMRVWLDKMEDREHGVLDGEVAGRG